MSLEVIRKDDWMDKETVLKPLERLTTLLSNTEYESEVLEIKKEIESILLFSIPKPAIFIVSVIVYMLLLIVELCDL